MPFLHRAAFFTTAAALTDLAFESRGEVAFAGRSNAGKSSAINTLANQKRLAFTSKTPGRTQHLNYFGLGDDQFLVDLPGYGYAKMQRSARAGWDAFLGSYLQTRTQLAGLILIMDARHPLTELDEQMLEWFTDAGKPVHVLLTKADKLTRNAQQTTLLKLRSTLNQRIGTNSVSLFSSLKKTGIDEAEAVVAHWLGITLPPKKMVNPNSVKTAPVKRIKAPHARPSFRTGGKTTAAKPVQPNTAPTKKTGP